MSLALFGLTGIPASAAGDPAAAQRHIERARKIAGTDLVKSLYTCDPKGLQQLVKSMEESSTSWFEPTRAFDNLYYIGNRFIGAWIVKTSAGLILIDSGPGTAETRDRLVPGLRTLGFDPADIKYVFVTHGHWDHYGGAKFLQDSYGARIGLSEADWGVMARQPLGSPERMNAELPRKDLVVTDGQKVTLGDTTITLYVTPGHTRGTVSVIIPARESNMTYPMSLIGGTAFPPTLEASERHGGMIAYEGSVRRFAALSRAAGAVGILNNHVSVDGSAERIAAALARKRGQPNPFVIGSRAVARHYDILHECVLAKMASLPGSAPAPGPRPDSGMR